MLDLFESKHLPPHLQPVAVEFRRFTEGVTATLGDGPELTAGLRKLLEAKDCLVRQAVIDHRDTGK